MKNIMPFVFAVNTENVKLDQVFVAGGDSWKLESEKSLQGAWHKNRSCGRFNHFAGRNLFFFLR